MFESFTKAWGSWQSMTEDAVARSTSFYVAMGKLAAQSTEQAFTVAEEVTKLTRASLTHQREVADELRKISIDAFKASTSAASATIA